MTIAEYRAVEIIASTMPAILRALERIADAQERMAEAEELQLKIVVAAFAPQANQLPAASAEGTPTPTTTQE